jgi:hypothetical protein
MRAMAALQHSREPRTLQPTAAAMSSACSSCSSFLCVTWPALLIHLQLSTCPAVVTVCPAGCMGVVLHKDHHQPIIRVSKPVPLRGYFVLLYQKPVTEALAALCPSLLQGHAIPTTRTCAQDHHQMHLPHGAAACPHLLPEKRHTLPLTGWAAGGLRRPVAADC